MANRTKLININGLCRTYELWNGRVSAGPELGVAGDALDGVRPSTWKPQGSSIVWRSFLVDEGETERNIPAIPFNILQAAEANPNRTVSLIHKEAPDVKEKFDLVGPETRSRDWYVELVDSLVYLTVDRYDEYGERYWYLPWQKAKERNPKLLGEGRHVEHPGRDAGSEDEQETSESDIDVESAAEADW